MNTLKIFEVTAFDGNIVHDSGFIEDDTDTFLVIAENIEDSHKKIRDFIRETEEDGLESPLRGKTIIVKEEVQFLDLISDDLTFYKGVECSLVTYGEDEYARG